MLTKLAVAAVSLMLVSAPVLAQTSPGERQDETKMRRDVGQERADTAAEDKLGARVAELRRRAGHEAGAQRDADVAEANRLDRQEAADHRRAQASYGAYSRTDKDLRQDETKAPH